MNVIALTEQPSTLYSVVLGAYCYDRDWVMSCLPDDVSVTVVRDTDRAGPGVYGPGDQRMQPPIRQHNLTEIVAPKASGQGCMHIKASWLWLRSGSRASVPHLLPRDIHPHRDTDSQLRRLRVRRQRYDRTH